LAHAQGPVPDPPQQVAPLLVEPVGVVCEQDVGEAVDAPQGGAQVVGDEVGEVLQLGVRAGQLGLLPDQLLLRALALGDVVQDQQPARAPPRAVAQRGDRQVVAAAPRVLPEAYLQALLPGSVREQGVEAGREAPQGVPDGDPAGAVEYAPRGRVEVDDPALGVYHHHAVVHPLYDGVAGHGDDVQQAEPEEPPGDGGPGEQKGEGRQVEVGRGREAGDVHPVADPGCGHGHEQGRALLTVNTRRADEHRDQKKGA